MTFIINNRMWHIEFVNASSEKLHRSDDSLTVGVTDGNDNCVYLSDLLSGAFTLDDSDFMNTNLSPGRNISFKTYYTVPVNAQSIELEYETNMWTEEKVVIKVQ